MALKGNAGFKYTPPGGSLTTVALGAPLRDLEPAHEQTRYARESLDRTVREVFTVGSGVSELVARARFIGNPSDFLTMLRHAANGVTLAYFPDLAVATSYDCLLIHDGPRVALSPDPERAGYGEYVATLRLRRTAGGTWADVIG